MWGLPVPLEDEEIEGTMYWVSFGVDEAILGPETVVIQQYGYTRLSQNCPVLNGWLILYEFHLNNYV